jgi:hypothetical protein
MNARILGGVLLLILGALPAEAQDLTAMRKEQLLKLVPQLDELEKQVEDQDVKDLLHAQRDPDAKLPTRNVLVAFLTVRSEDGKHTKLARGVLAFIAYLKSANGEYLVSPPVLSSQEVVFMVFKMFQSEGVYSDLVSQLLKRRITFELGRELQEIALGKKSSELALGPELAMLVRYAKLSDPFDARIALDIVNIPFCAHCIRPELTPESLMGNVGDYYGHVVRGSGLEKLFFQRAVSSEGFDLSALRAVLTDAEKQELEDAITHLKSNP